jgi:hypothetical protein
MPSLYKSPVNKTSSQRKMIHAEKASLETDPQGRLKTLPTLPPNCRVEAIFLVLEELASRPPAKRRPAPSIAGKGKTLGDLIAPIVPEEDRDFLT